MLSVLRRANSGEIKATGLLVVFWAGQRIVKLSIASKISVKFVVRSWQSISVSVSQ